MKQALWIGLLVFAVAGCGQKAKELVNGPEGNNNNNGQHSSEDKVTNTTQTEICLKPASSPPTLFRSWSIDYKYSNGLEVHHIFTFKAHTVATHVICKAEGFSVPAEVEVDARYTGNKILFLQGQAFTNTGSDGNVDISCPAELKKGEQMTYSFQGPCLKLMKPDGYLLMVPEYKTDLNNEDLKTKRIEDTL